MSAASDPVRIAVLLGGRSAEREVSLNSGAQVARALRERGHEVVEIDPLDDDFVALLRASRADVVFIALHGRLGEDGTMQGLLEVLGLPYVGSGVLASAVAMNKVVSKHLYTQAGLKTPAYLALRRGAPIDVERITAELGPRTVVKPANEGSSVGMTIVHDPAGLADAIDLAFRHDTLLLVERFEDGVEVTVGVIGNDEPLALPTLEIVPANEFYDYESKYTPGMSEHIIPARVGETSCGECQRLALGAHVALGCRGMSRSDTIVTPAGEVFLLETNTIPGMTSTSLLPDAAAAAGITFPDLCERLVRLGLEEWRVRSSLRHTR